MSQYIRIQCEIYRCLSIYNVRYIDVSVYIYNVRYIDVSVYIYNVRYIDVSVYTYTM